MRADSLAGRIVGAIARDPAVASSAVDAVAVGGVAAGAVQAAGVEDLEEPLVAGVLIHQGRQGEVHGGISVRALRLEPGPLCKSCAKNCGHHPGPMSQHLF